MNYVQHTRAAHELLLARPNSRPHHISLYLALFHQWNAQRFPKCLELEHATIMQAARIGNQRTYRATLRDLETWSLLTYHPSQSRHQPSRCCLTDLSTLPQAQVPEVKPATEGTSAPDKAEPPRPEVPEALGAEVAPMPGIPGAEVPQDTVLSKTVVLNSGEVNGTAAAPKKKEGQAFSDDGFLEVEVLDADQPRDPSGAGAAPKKKVAPKKKGVHADTIRAAATSADDEPRRRPPLPELLFSQSAIANPDAFVAAFQGTDYALADLRHYHQLVATWRDKKTGLPPTRKDWIATASRFMLNDAAENRLKLAPAAAPVRTADGNAQNPGGPTTGYRSKRWD